MRIYSFNFFRVLFRVVRVFRGFRLFKNPTTKHTNHTKRTRSKKSLFLRKSKMGLPCQSDSRELPTQMRMEKIPVRFAAVARRRYDRCTAEHHLIDHELPVIFSDGAAWFLKSRICQVSRVRPFPSKSPIEFVTRGFPFKFSRKTHS